MSSKCINCLPRVHVSAHICLGAPAMSRPRVHVSAHIGYCGIFLPDSFFELFLVSIMKESFCGCLCFQLFFPPRLNVLRLAFFFFSRRERAFSKSTHTRKRKRHLKESDNDFSRVVVYHVSMGILLRRRSLHLQDHLRRLPRSGEHGRRRWVHPRRGTRHPSQPRGERARVRHRMVRVEPVARLERLERVVLVFETVLLHDDCGAVARQELTKFEQSNQHEFIVRTRESSRTRGERARV